MIVSLANAIRFYRVDDDWQNFDNRAYRDVFMINHLIYDYCQKYWNEDVVKLQFKVIHDTGAPVVTVFVDDGTSATPALSLINAYIEYDFYVLTLDLSTYGGKLIEIEATHTIGSYTEVYRTNPIEVTVDEPTELLGLHWFNDDNAFEMDYSTGLTPAMRIEGVIRLAEEAAGEQSVYDNQEEMVKLFEEVKRVMTLRIPHIPEQLIEQLRIAAAHDHFFVNGVEFVAESAPTYSLDDMTNTGEFSVNLTQKNIIGYNTHDVGYDADSGDKIQSMVFQEIGASGPFTLTVPQGYLIQSFTVLYNSGTGVVVRAGTGIDKSDVVYDIVLRSAADNTTETVNMDFAPAADRDLYVGVEGSGVDIDVYMILLKNRQ